MGLAASGKRGLGRRDELPEYSGRQRTRLPAENFESSIRAHRKQEIRLGRREILSLQDNRIGSGGKILPGCDGGVCEFRYAIGILQSALRSGNKLMVRSIYALTRIYLIRHIKSVGTAFEVIAEPNRRAILSLLASSEQSVGEIERQLRMPQPTVSKHLRVLREAGFVESTVDAQRRLYRLRPEPLQEVDAWLAQFRRFWSAHLDALERHLDRMEQTKLTQRKARNR